MMKTLKEKTEIKNLYSFDIFDTLVTRRTATPKGIFFLMQELLKNNNDFSVYLRENFKNIRCETEDFVRELMFKRNNYQDITFDEIYERIQINHSLTDKQTDYLKNLEIQCEINNLIPIDENINKIKELVNRNCKVILISDMYHSESTLRKILSNIDPVFNNIEIFVSSQYRKTKSRGGLYKLIKVQLKPEFWEHSGDNRYADYASAKHFKIKANLYKYPTFKGYEKEALKENNLSTEYIIGTAKNLRLKSNNSKYDFGASFAGPILYYYVDWIIESALKSNIEHLYFIARDGYIPKLIADIIIKGKNLQLKTHYLYGSRKAWRVPAEKTVDQFITNIFQEYFNLFSPEFLCERLGINPGELKQYTGLDYNAKILRNKKRKKLFNKLIDDADFKTFLINKHKPKADLIVSYLKQEIDITKNNFAFVDINGTGRTSDIIAELLQTSIQTFFFCSDKNLTEKPESIKRIFMCSCKYKHFWLELLCRTPDGQTIGYKDINERIEPVLEQVNPEKLIKWGYNDYLKGILDFTNKFFNLKIKPDIDFYCRYFDYVMNSIDKETAEILGSIPYCATGDETKAEECAPSYNFLSFLFCKKPELLFISSARSTKPAQILIKCKTKYKSFRKFLVNIHFHKKKNEAYLCILGIKIDLAKFIFRGN